MPATKWDRQLRNLKRHLFNHQRKVLGLLFLLPLLLAGSAVVQKSVTVDEFPIIPSGLFMLRQGSIDLATDAPPLTDLLPSLPVLFTDARHAIRPASEYVSRWHLAIEFMVNNVRNYQFYFNVGRTVSLLFLFIACFLAYRISLRLYGESGALLTALIVGLTPNLLGHGPLVTHDIYVTVGVLGSLWALYRFVEKPDGLNATLLGLAFALATLSKFSEIILVGVFAVVFCLLMALERNLPRKSKQRTDWRKVWAFYVWSIFVLILTINANYLFHGTSSAMSSFTFKTSTFLFIQRVLPGWLPVPLPALFISGIDAQMAQPYMSYFMGEFEKHGFWSYYLVAFLIKSPVPLLFLAALATLSSTRITRKEIPLVATAVLLFIAFSMARQRNIGLRYVLFLEPMLAIWIGRLSVARPDLTKVRRKVLQWSTAAGASCLAITALLIWPNYIAYFNFIVGGPEKGHEYLLDSNLDWGQDLMVLKDYMRQEGIHDIDLAYCGRVDPVVYGIPHHMLGNMPRQRYVGISTNLLWGFTYFVNGTGFWPGYKHPYRAFLMSYQSLKPKVILGGTISIFDMSDFPDRPTGPDFNFHRDTSFVSGTLPKSTSPIEPKFQ